LSVSVCNPGASTGQSRAKQPSGARSPEELARELLAAAAVAPDPAPLLAAAQALLEQAARERENVTRLEDERQRLGG
jgi:histidinol-phosphate/aromatic aminotransferase/cobyric acid decarboxylase-like protein